MPAKIDFSILDKLTSSSTVPLRSVPSVKPSRRGISNIPITEYEQKKIPLFGTELSQDDPLYSDNPWADDEAEAVRVRQDKIRICFDVILNYMLEHDAPQSETEWERAATGRLDLPYNNLTGELFAACVDFWQRELKEGVTKDWGF